MQGRGIPAAKRNNDSIFNGVVNSNRNVGMPMAGEQENHG
jgi:hypothetical protein